MVLNNGLSKSSGCMSNASVQLVWRKSAKQLSASPLNWLKQDKTWQRPCIEIREKVVNIGAFVWDQNAVGVDFQLLSRRCGGKSPTSGGHHSRSCKTFNFLTLFSKCLIVTKCSKCSLALHCVTIDDSGWNGTRCYHRDEMALSVTIGVK